MSLFNLRNSGQAHHARRPRLRRALMILAALSLLPIAAATMTGCEDEVVEPSTPPPNPNSGKGKRTRAGGDAAQQRQAATPTSTGGWEPVYGDRRAEQGRDPFYGFIDEIIAQRARAAEEARQAAATDLEEEPLKPAQRFDVLDFRLVAVITNTAQPKALLIDPHGNSHRLRVGDLIGKKNGVIVDIRRDEVEILQGENLLEGEQVIMRLHPELPPGVQLEFR